MEFVAQIHWKPTVEGGRTSPARNGYRPAFYFGEKQTDGALTFLEHEEALPGSESQAKIRIIHPESLGSALRQGAAFEIREGKKVVGIGIVLHIEK